LVAAGARVVKVESTTRPDGARRGSTAFFELLHAGKESATVDLTRDGGRRDLASLVAGADIVLEGSRPRALEQLGIHRAELLLDGGPQVWVSITGHGRVGAARDRVGFGDDAAVGGGLVVWDEEGPCFCADAVADPSTGLTAAAAVADALTLGGRWTIDVALASVAAHLAGPTLPVPPGLDAAPPRARTPQG
jgi:crotonobetainyl-CoA:carnitine CoA-transferase CaiB-like acyl-CoA transferase